MTQEQKGLLLKDLCARLPYHVKADFYGEEEEQQCIDTVDSIYWVVKDRYEVVIGQYDLPIESIKPYLSPLSNMTEEQKYSCPIGYANIETFIEKTDWTLIEIEPNLIIHFIDWLNKNHFDYRGLIEMGLAIDATNLNIY